MGCGGTIYCWSDSLLIPAVELPRGRQVVLFGFAGSAYTSAPSPGRGATAAAVAKREEIKNKARETKERNKRNEQLTWILKTFVDELMAADNYEAVVAFRQRIAARVRDIGYATL